jgi:hypothetical protein
MKWIQKQLPFSLIYYDSYLWSGRGK